MSDKLWDIARGVCETESDGVARAFSQMDRASFVRAVEALETAERIGASACGHSGIACMHFVHLMCCIRRPARFLSPSEAVHGALGFIRPGDVMLLASRGGKTAELLPILAICKQSGARVIAVTENTDSPLARDSDIVLRLHITREVDPYNAQGTTSFTVMSVLFDALQCALIHKTAFENAEFVRVHPGGAVGERFGQCKSKSDTQSD